MHAGVGGGALAAGVLLVTSAAAGPAVAPPQPAAAPAAKPDRPVIASQHNGSWIADREDPVPPDADPGAVTDAGVVSTVDDPGAGPMIPAVFTGDIPTTVLDAYRRARDAVNLAQPGCHLPLELLEAIGKVETGHARGGQVDTRGDTLRPILGPQLDGNGFASIGDTDGGTLDGDTVWDRAVGPMQFIPGTWRRWASDGNGDGRANPHNIYDASLAAARYLCAANRDLGTPEGLDAAILSYNHSTSYRNLVVRWMATYAAGTVVVPDAGALPVQVITPSTPAGTVPTAPPVPTSTPPVSTPPTSTPSETPTSTPPSTPTSTVPSSEPEAPTTTTASPTSSPDSSPEPSPEPTTEPADPPVATTTEAAPTTAPTAPTAPTQPSEANG